MIIQEDISPFNSPHDDVLKNTCYVESCGPWHGTKLYLRSYVSQLINYVPLAPPHSTVRGVCCLAAVPHGYACILLIGTIFDGR